jgi:hypothetical protein
MTHGIDILCLSEGLINCLDMLSAHDLKTCKEVSRVFRQAVEETNQRRLAECRDSSILCFEIQMRTPVHYFRYHHRDISPTTLYWRTFNWMLRYVKRDNILYNNKTHDLAIENACRHSSLGALCSIASVQQTENEQYLFNWLKQPINEGVASMLDAVNRQTTSLDIEEILMDCCDANTRSNFRTVLNEVIDTRNRHLARENACSDSSLGALSSIASVQQTENEQYLVNWLKQFANEALASIQDEVNQQTTSLDIVRLLMQCVDAHTLSLDRLYWVLNEVIETRNRPCLEFLKFDRLNQDYREDLFVSAYDSIRIVPGMEEPVTERIPHRSICTPTVIAAASICAILSIGVVLLNSLK